MRTHTHPAGRLHYRYHLSPIPLRYPMADQVADADLCVRVVCVSQTGRKLVESLLRSGLRPGSSYLCDLLSAQKSRKLQICTNLSETRSEIGLATRSGTWIA